MKKSKIKIDLVVTRHPGLVDYLKEVGLADETTQVVEHATPEMIQGKHVAGVLPHNLSCMCESFTEIPLALTPEMRGKELDLETLRRVAGKPVTYVVKRVR